MLQEIWQLATGKVKVFHDISKSECLDKVGILQKKTSEFYFSIFDDKLFSFTNPKGLAKFPEPSISSLILL